MPARARAAGASAQSPQWRCRRCSITQKDVCLTGCAEHGVHERSTARRLLDAFGLQGLWVELQRPYARHDRARNRALAALARELGVKVWPPAMCTPIRAHAPSCRMPSWRCATT